MLFETTDPGGYKVVCTKKRWHNHILNEHPELVGEEERIIQAIREPLFSFIYQDKDYDNRNIDYLLDNLKKY